MESGGGERNILLLHLFMTLECVNFIKVLQAAFTHADPKSTNKTVKLSVFFALLGSVCAKAAHRMLVKLTPGFI